MRISSASLLAVTLFAGCTIGDQGGSGSNKESPDAAPAGTDAPASSSNPGLSAAVDRATVSTALGLTETVTVTLTSTGGYTGAVSLSPTLSNGGGTAITDITVSGPASVTVPANSTATAMFTVVIPTNADLVTDGATGGTTGTTPTPATLAASLSVAITGGPTVAPATSAFSIANEYDVIYKDGTGNGTNSVAKHFISNTPIMVKRGALLVFKNLDTTAAGHVTHGDGAWPHQEPSNAASDAPVNTTYTVDTSKSAVGATGQLGCHTDGASTYTTYTTD